jgi:hypothetical protein
MVRILRILKGTGESCGMFHLIPQAFDNHDIPDTFPVNPDPFQPPLTFMRCWDDRSYTKYNDSLSFRCSGWTTYKPANSFTELKNSGILTTQKLKSHCEAKATPSH